MLALRHMLDMTVRSSAAQQLLHVLAASGVDFAVSVPCNTLTELLLLLDRQHGMRHVPVTREEEGVGLCAGAALAGRFPVMLMQNSGLGNCLNAILSLSQLYALPLLILISYRGGPDESIDAQRPMGQAMRPLLQAVNVPFEEIETVADLSRISDLAAIARTGFVAAGILHPGLWKSR